MTNQEKESQNYKGKEENPMGGETYVKPENTDKIEVGLETPAGTGTETDTGQAPAGDGPEEPVAA